MAAKLKEGDAVEWRSPQGKVTGRVQQASTHPFDIAGHHVAASADNPEYLVRSDRTGALAAHEPAALKKTSS